MDGLRCGTFGLSVQDDDSSVVGDGDFELLFFVEFDVVDGSVELFVVGIDFEPFAAGYAEA